MQLRFRKFVSELKIALRSSLEVLLEPRWMITFATLFFLIIVLLQWLFLPSSFWTIVTNKALSVTDKLDTLIQAFFDIFRFVDDLTPISFILIALLQATALVTWLALRSIISKRRSSQLGSLGIGLIGSGCVACGGSVLSPLLSAIASGISITVAERIGDVVLVGAVYLSFRAWRQISLEYAFEKSKT